MSLSLTCKTLLSDSSPVLTSTFSKMHFLAVALVYAAADSSKDSDTLFAGEIKSNGERNHTRVVKCLVIRLLSSTEVRVWESQLFVLRLSLS